MAKTNTTPLEKIQKGKGRDIARIFFLYHFPPSSVTKVIYPETCERRKGKNKHNFVMPLVQNYLSEWKKEGFIETIKMKIPIEKKNNISYLINSKCYRFNLKPLYIYCKEKYKIEFTKEEEGFIDYLFSSKSQRFLVLREFPKDNIINAILKFYIKHYVLSYAELFTAEKLSKKSSNVLDKNNTKLLKDVIKKADILNKNVKVNWEDSYKKIKSIREITKDWKIDYTMKYKQNPELMSNINKKFIMTLGILPNS